jgi:hypothetical protein
MVLTQIVRKVRKSDVQRSTNQGAILARVQRQGALLARREEGGTEGVSQHIEQVLSIVGAAHEQIL